MKSSLINIKFENRWYAIGLLIIALSGGYSLVYALAPLQSLLQQWAQWNLSAYSRYSSAESFLNVFCGILLVVGWLIDRWGVQRCGIFAGILMFTGGGINYYALSPFFLHSPVAQIMEKTLNLPLAWWNLSPFYIGMPASAKLAAIGFMIFGVGMEMGGVAASRATVRWFRDKELAVAMGIQLALSRVVVAMALWLSPRIAQWNGEISLSRPVGYIVILLALGVMAWILYSRINSSGNREPQMSVKPDLRLQQKYELPKSHKKLLALLAGICVVYYSSLISFYRYATDMLQTTLEIGADSAAAAIAALPLISALATPLICLIPDFKGGATWLMSVGSIFMMSCYLIFGIILPLCPSLTVTYLAITLLGFASAAVSAGLWPLLPRLAPENLLGRTYATFYWLQAVGLYLTPLAVAWVMTDKTTYTPTMWLFAGLSLVSLVGSIVLTFINKIRKLGLNSPNRKKA